MLAFSTFKIFPRIGKIAWNSRFRPCFAEPPAESPSTINNSHFSGSLEEQSANFPGRLLISNVPLRRVISRARLAAIRALEATIPFSMICRPTVGFSIKNFMKCSENKRSTTVRTSELPSLVLVCPSNWGSGCLMEMTAVKPSRTSSPERFSSLSFISFCLRA